jgi:hypothetical protein
MVARLPRQSPGQLPLRHRFITPLVTPRPQHTQHLFGHSVEIVTTDMSTRHAEHATRLVHHEGDRPRSGLATDLRIPGALADRVQQRELTALRAKTGACLRNLILSWNSRGFVDVGGVWPVSKEQSFPISQAIVDAHPDLPPCNQG